jgi:protein-disulfide isomerase
MRRLGGPALIPAWLLALAAFALTPALVYARSVPSYQERVKGCGKLASAEDPDKALLHVTPPGAVQPVLMVVDPLCPTCKAFHQRLAAEGLLERLDITLLLFPLAECNWNLTTPLHPGACLVARAVLCGEDRAMSVLEWAYAEQEVLTAAGKSRDAEQQLADIVEQRWPGMRACLADKKTQQRLDKMLRFATKNKLPISTPQLFVGDSRLCDEDSDIGLPYALRELAPALAEKP